MKDSNGSIHMQVVFGHVLRNLGPIPSFSHLSLLFVITSSKGIFGQFPDWLMCRQPQCSIKMDQTVQKKNSNHTEIMRSKVPYSKLYSSLYFSASRNCNFFKILKHCAHRHSMYKICGLLRTDKVISCGLLVQIMMYYNGNVL